jgi:prepilin-type N-terminal cleavage/methylation domain-containing protein
VFARPGAFTLLELLVVVAIIAILAGLTLGTMGYVNRKGAESRARAEIAAIAVAIDSYKLDLGSYPPAPTNATNAPTELYKELTGQGTINTDKIYIEATPGLVTNTAEGPFIDPWGTPYRYSTNPATIENVGFYDLWTSNNAPTNRALWIRN